MAKEWDLGSSSEIIASLGDFNGHVGKCAEGFKGVHSGNGIGKRNEEGRRLLEFCDEKSCAWQTLGFIKTDKRKITYSAGGCQTKIDFVLVLEKYGKYIRNVKVISWELQHRLVVVDLDKKVLQKGCEKAADHKKKDLEVE